jgi:hypothetical protein
MPLILQYDSKPIDFAQRVRRLVPVFVTTDEAFSLRHGMKETPTICRLDMADGEALMTVYCIDKDVAIVSFSNFPIKAVVSFE